MSGEKQDDAALFFLPFADIDHHARLEDLVIRDLSRYSDASIFVVTCSGIFNSGCTCFSAVGLSPDASNLQKRLVCLSCKRASSNRSIGGVNRLELSQYVLRDDEIEWKKYQRSIRPANWRDFVVDGVPLGRYASYETVLNFKTADFSRPVVWSGYLGYLKSCFFSYRAAERILEELRPSIVACHSFQYGINRSFVEPFRRVQTKCIHFVNDGQVDQRSTSALIIEAREDFLPDQRSLIFPYSSNSMTRVGTDVVIRQLQDWIQARSLWTFSLPRTQISAQKVRTKLGVEQDSKVILVLTSSPDEPLAFEEAGFTDPKETGTDDREFLKTIHEFARLTPELTWVVRLHPRLYGGVRNDHRSPYLDEILEPSLTRPRNMIVNTPEDSLSLYDLALVSDVVVNLRSTAGLEMALIGLPVAHFKSGSLKTYPEMVGFELDDERSDRAVQELLQLLHVDNQVLAHKQIQAALWVYHRFHKAVYHFEDRTTVLENVPSRGTEQEPLMTRLEKDFSARVKKWILRRFPTTKLIPHLRNRWLQDASPIKDLLLGNGIQQITPTEFFDRRNARSLSRDENDHDNPVSDEFVRSEIKRIVFENLGPWDGFEGRISQLTGHQ